MGFKIFTKKPQEIAAVQFDGSTESINEIKRLTRCDIVLHSPRYGDSTLTINVEEKNDKDVTHITLELGQYVARSVWPGKLDIYDAEEFHEMWQLKNEYGDDIDEI